MTAGEAISEVSLGTRLGELVADRPGRAELFERLRFDYCCGGAKTLREACRERGLDPNTIREQILSDDAAPDVASEIEWRDWRQASLDELCEHIVEAHHVRLHRDLPQIGELLASVMRVHGPVHLELHELSVAFALLRDELEPHLELEEQVLFPACRALEAGLEQPGVDEATLGLFEHDHGEVGEALAKLREVTHDYDTSRALCRTHRRLLEALRALELDLHQHIHEENNMLLPRLRSILDPHREAAVSASADAPPGPLVPPHTTGDALPACCQGWLGEQAHRAFRRAARAKEVPCR